jgi:hypothetical protein
MRHGTCRSWNDKRRIEGDRFVEDNLKWHSKIVILAVGREVGATRLPRYAKWLQLEGRLVSEVVGVGCEIHITQMYRWNS